jgi:hypothetical protein
MMFVIFCSSLSLAFFDLVLKLTARPNTSTSLRSAALIRLEQFSGVFHRQRRFWSATPRLGAKDQRPNLGFDRILPLAMIVQHSLAKERNICSAKYLLRLPVPGVERTFE